MVQHAPRLLPSHTASTPAPFQLLPKPRGALQNLVPEPLHLGLAAGEVLVEVHAVGVNFRDVLNVLGMYPGDPGPPGADCAGVVTAIGAAVRKLDLGTDWSCTMVIWLSTELGSRLLLLFTMNICFRLQNSGLCLVMMHLPNSTTL